MHSQWYPCDLILMYLNFQLTMRFEAWTCFNLFRYPLKAGGRQEMPALLKREWRLDVTLAHHLYIYSLWAKIQLHSIKSGSQHRLLNCRLEGFLLAALFSSCGGILFASANPLFLRSFSFSLWLSVFSFPPYFPPPISSLFISSSPVEHKLLCEWHLCQNQLDCQRGTAEFAALCGLYE